MSLRRRSGGSAGPSAGPARAPEPCEALKRRLGKAVKALRPQPSAKAMVALEMEADMPSPSSALPHSLWDDLNGEVCGRHGFQKAVRKAFEWL